MLKNTKRVMRRVRKRIDDLERCMIPSPCTLGMLEIIMLRRCDLWDEIEGEVERLGRKAGEE